VRYNLSYRDLEEMLVKRGVEVDHTSLYRWAQCFALQLMDAAAPCRHVGGPAGSSTRPTFAFRAAGALPVWGGRQHGQEIDVLLSAKRDKAADRRFPAG